MPNYVAYTVLTLKSLMHSKYLIVFQILQVITTACTTVYLHVSHVSHVSHGESIAISEFVSYSSPIGLMINTCQNKLVCECVKMKFRV